MDFGLNPSLISSSGTTFQISQIGNGSANVHVAQVAYGGSRTDMLDDLSRPIPPFVKVLSP